MQLLSERNESIRAGNIKLEAMVKAKEEQTRKERNTQRRKRKNGWLHKGHLLWEICDFEVAAYARNPETGQIYTYRSHDEVWFPPSMEDIVSTTPGPSLLLEY